MSKKLRDKVEYLVLLIAEFAVRCKVTEAASSWLAVERRFRGCLQGNYCTFTHTTEMKVADLGLNDEQA